MFASVIVNISSSNVDQKFEYIVPSEMETLIQVGSRVVVDFAKFNREVMGYVLDVYEHSVFPGEKKPIKELLDLKPLITLEQIKLALFIESDTVCPLIRVLNTMIPQALQLKTNKYIHVNSIMDLHPDLVAAFNGESDIIYNRGLSKYLYLIEKERVKGNITYSYEAVQVVKQSYKNKYYVNPKMVDNVDRLRSIDYRNFILNFNNKEALFLDEIVDEYDIPEHSIRYLTTKKYLLYKKEVVSRIRHRNIGIKKEFLTPNVLDKVKSTVNEIMNKETPVLYIPSDDTEKRNVLVDLCVKMYSENKKTIIFTPDIISSLKYSSIIRKYTGFNVLTINSNLSEGEYLDIYNEIIDDNYDVVVTTPKGAFLPYKNVGLYYMIDEEDDCYYNDQSPRFDLHRCLFYMSHNFNAGLIMESYSPDVKDYCYGLKNIYSIIDHKNIDAPKNLEVVDLKQEMRSGNNTYISSRLLSLMTEAKKKNKQSLLLINNKSFSTYCECRSCGDVVKCPNCDFSLRYNEKTNQLLCPQCSYREDYTGKCKSCGSDKIRFGGVGMETIVSTLNDKYPSLNVLCIDSNTKYKDYADKLVMIDENECDVIVTSVTFAKGINNQNIDVVGVINLDSTIKTPSYDAESRTYNLLVHSSQYLGSEEGTLVIQTSYLDNIALKSFIIGDYHGFMRKEIEQRKLSHNEPYYHVNRLIIKAKYEEMFKVANAIRFALKEIAGNKVYIIGPTYSKYMGGAVLIIKHNYPEINRIYQTIYERYQATQVSVIFDKYPKIL